MMRIRNRAQVVTSTLAWVTVSVLLTSQIGSGALSAQLNQDSGNQQWTLVGALQDGGNQQSTLVGELTATNARADFEVLRRALEEAHAGLYRFSTKPELDRRFDGYRARLNRPISQRAFIALVSEMLANIRDGHMRLEYDEATAGALAGSQLFPLRLLIEGSRLMVLSNDTPGDSAIRPGMEILRINDRTASEVLNLILPKLSGDGFIETGKKTRLGRNFGQNYWLFVEETAEFTIVARDAAGRSFTATLAGVKNADRGKNRNPVNEQIQTNVARLDGPRENVSLRFVNDPEIAHLRVRAFDGQDYPASIETAFRALRDKETKVLILDLRGNGGGVDDYGAVLVSQFTDKPFRYFDRIHLTTINPSFTIWKQSTYDNLRNGVVPDPAGGYLVTAKLHKGISEQLPGKYPFLGKVFVLLDGGTFSTAADVAAVLYHLRRATFVGEESGGAYEGNTSNLNAVVTLPNSRLRVKIHMYGYWNAVSAKKPGRGILPDYPVARTTADLLRGVDVPWDRAVALARAALNHQSTNHPSSR